MVRFTELVMLNINFGEQSTHKQRLGLSLYREESKFMRKGQQKRGMLLHESIASEIPNHLRVRLSHVRLNQIRFVIDNLKGFSEIYARRTTLADIIEFGHWLKTDRKYTLSDENGDLIETTRKGMGNSSIMTYLTVILSHLTEIGVGIRKNKISREFPFKTEKPSIPEDIVEAILDTEIESENHKHILDAIKLILLHGFRYSDLWVLRKDKCIFTTDEDVKYFKYNPPKNHTSISNKDDGTKVALHPLAEKIIDYWADRKTKSIWNASRVPQAFFDKSIYPYFRLVGAGRKDAFFIFEDPIIKIPHHLLDASVRKMIFFPVHKTWLMKKYGDDWQPHFKEPIGLMKPVDHKGTVKKLYETLGYHTFRHVYCSRFLAKGGNVIDLRDNVGHSSIAVTQQYAHTVDDERINRSREFI